MADKIEVREEDLEVCRRTIREDFRRLPFDEFVEKQAQVQAAQMAFIRRYAQALHPKDMKERAEVHKDTLDKLSGV